MGANRTARNARPTRKADALQLFALRSEDLFRVEREMARLVRGLAAHQGISRKKAHATVNVWFEQLDQAEHPVAPTLKH